MDDQLTLRRRARLRELIKDCFDNKAANLLAHIKAVTGQDQNQGEISSLCKDNGPKSFGQRRAVRLAQQVGLCDNWFDLPLGVFIARDQWDGKAASIDLNQVIMVDEAHKSGPTWPATTPTPGASHHAIAITASPASMAGVGEVPQHTRIEVALMTLKDVIGPLDWGMRDAATSVVALFLEGKNSLEKTVNSLDSLLQFSEKRPTQGRSAKTETLEKSGAIKNKAA